MAGAVAQNIIMLLERFRMIGHQLCVRAVNDFFNKPPTIIGTKIGNAALLATTYIKQQCSMSVHSTNIFQNKY